MLSSGNGRRRDPRRGRRAAMSSEAEQVEAAGDGEQEGWTEYEVGSSSSGSAVAVIARGRDGGGGEGGGGGGCIV